MKKEIMMKCGHAANGYSVKDNVRIPACAICACLEIDENPASIENRMAKCTCGKTVKSERNLPFFAHKPESKYDSYYCGCYGWN